MSGNLLPLRRLSQYRRRDPHAKPATKMRARREPCARSHRPSRQPDGAMGAPAADADQPVPRRKRRFRSDEARRPATAHRHRHQRARAQAYGNSPSTTDGLRLGALMLMADAADHPGVKKRFPVVAQSLTAPQNGRCATWPALAATCCSVPAATITATCHVPPATSATPAPVVHALHGFARILAILGTSDHCIANYPGDFAHALVALDAKSTSRAPAGTRSPSR